jgi:alkanesulfonate monooxygenase SsuD/methylene tetrahydromethanopterin reductase-like flavin-dependent oxidoreductase (luciferase family)
MIGGVEVGFGLITCQRYPGDARTDADLYRDAVDVAVRSEELGFDSVWVSEHHFLDDGYMPSLLPVCAAIAARTSRVRIGTAVLLAPLHDPVRLAEDAATVDLLSNGRFTLGLGLGWREEEFEGLRIPPRSRRSRLVDAIAILRQAWSDGLVTGTAATPYTGVSVTPKPPRTGGPPIWIGGFAEPAVRRAGAIADGFMASDVTPDSLARAVGWAREEVERRGGDQGAFEVSVHLPTFPWHGDEAWERVRDHHWYVSWKYDDMEAARGRTGPPPAPPPIPADRETELRESILLGEPAAVAERIRALRDAAGGRLHYIARLYWPGMDPAVRDESMRLFAEEVVPLLR